MQNFNKIYIDFYFFIMAFYLLFNKGVAYTFCVEILLAFGLLLILLNRKVFEIFKEKKYVLILFLCFITLFYVLFGFLKYNYLNVIRDSFAFEYALFAIIIFFFKDDKEYIWQKIIKLYRWAPLILLLNTLIFYYVILYLPPIEIFGGQPLFLYKNGDKSLHLLVSTIFMILFTHKYSRNWLILNTVLILINLVILLAFTRSGSLAYIAGIFCFFFFFIFNLYWGIYSVIWLLHLYCYPCITE